MKLARKLARRFALWRFWLSAYLCVKWALLTGVLLSVHELFVRRFHHMKRTSINYSFTERFACIQMQMRNFVNG